MLRSSHHPHAEPRPHEPPLLFDLNIDPGETFNLSTNHPAVVAELMKEIEAHRATVTPAPSQLEEVQPVENPTVKP